MQTRFVRKLMYTYVGEFWYIIALWLTNGKFNKSIFDTRTKNSLTPSIKEMGRYSCTRSLTIMIISINSFSIDWWICNAKPGSYVSGTLAILNRLPTRCWKHRKRSQQNHLQARYTEKHSSNLDLTYWSIGVLIQKSFQKTVSSVYRKRVYVF